MFDFQEGSQDVVDAVLTVAALLTDEWVPGLVALAMIGAAALLFLVMLKVTDAQLRSLRSATKLVTNTTSELEFAGKFSEISAALGVGSPKINGPKRRIADVWREYRETLIEPTEEGRPIQNSIRPSAFFNIGNLGFGLRSWRFWPGLFVSIGLLLTFLGLVAALQQTGGVLDAADGGSRNNAMGDALNDLLTVASAKFIMSLSGLFVSILLIGAIRWRDSSVDRAVSHLAHSLEDRLQFVSLERLSQQQLEEAKETRTHMAKLNMELITALAKPLQDAAEAGGNAAVGAMKGVAEKISATLSDTVTEASEKMEAAATSMSETTVGLDSVSRRIEMVVGELNSAAEALSSAATPVADSISQTEQMTRTIAKSSVELVENASAALKSQTEAVVVAAEAISQQVRAFEERAKAYDGDMARALEGYRKNLDAAVEKVSRFSGDVHADYSDALQRLRAVIDSARSFEPTTDDVAVQASDVDQETLS
ncbi:hypothetical protein [uncultured Tateyamaria sp.]|uniref:hypothetical protein n=1 Tax=Tateyamaria sp. 1078 TaxID=3417464 RepID=UPI002614C0E7|nr:hypothetical protein [uncultured Tateyamaria sp.]